jgi:hypothetical protein
MSMRHRIPTRLARALLVLGAATALLLPASSAQAAAQAAAPAASAVLWQQNPSSGAKQFDGVEEAPGTITAAADPTGTYGTTTRYDTWQNSDGSKARCESRGLRTPAGSVLTLGTAQQGQTYYLGWRALWNPLPTTKGAWTSLFQLHVSGQSASQPSAGPFVLRTLGDGQLHFQLTSPDGSDRHLWNTALPVGSWHTFVIGFRLSTANSGSSAGWTEFWYDGKQQTFTNGSTRYTGATLWGSHVNVKWGVYRSGANKVGHSVAYLNGAKLGTTYAAVAP